MFRRMAFIIAAIGIIGASAAPQNTVVESVNTSGAIGDGYSTNPSLSVDGRFIVFESAATNLVLGDFNNAVDIFVRDRLTGETTRASVNTLGNQANSPCYSGVISGDGRYVAFESGATNLFSGSFGSMAIIVRDRTAGTTVAASVDSQGNPANDQCSGSAVSIDGRFVAFSSTATNLVTGDVNGKYDVFVRDLQLGQTTIASVNSFGLLGNADSGSPSLSADGRYVAFYSAASTLVFGDTNSVPDIFVRDRQTGQTERVSVNSGGGQSNAYSDSPSISGDGRYVAFVSNA